MRKIEKGSGSIMLIYFKTSSEITSRNLPHQDDKHKTGGIC